MKYFLVNVLQDNQVWVLVKNNDAIVIDCGEAKPVLDFLQKHNYNLKYILLTHHHYDHIDGVNELQQSTNAKIVGNLHYKNLLPKLDIEVEDGSIINLLDEEIKVLSTAGHSRDHISYFVEGINWLFSGDCLFPLGCGRLIDGTAEQMIESLDKISVLPDNTKIFSGHNYIAKNYQFCNYVSRQLYIDVKDVNIVSTLEFEKKYNVFLNHDNNNLKEQLFSRGETGLGLFSHLRALRNSF